MAGAFTTDIPGSECLGDSRPRINTNFTSLDTAIQQLSSFNVADTPTVDLSWDIATKTLQGAIKSNSITTTQLSSDAVGTVNLSAQAVTTDKIALSAVTANRINLVTSLSSNGYQIMPGGLIMQWGTLSSVGGAGPAANTSFAFPIPFPVAPLSLATTGQLASSDRLSYTDLTTTGATLQVANTNGATVQAATIKYIALGY
jgi:hypothetical protein